MSIPVHLPVIITDGGPWAYHDVACSVCQEEKAILEFGLGFQPCWACQSKGWSLIKEKKWKARLRRWWRN